MPKPRVAEMPQPQRPPPRVPLHLRTTNIDSNGAHAHGRRVGPKPEANVRRSPRTPLQELPTSASAANQRIKRGTRVSELETKLGHAKEELRKLKEQLACAEAAKKDAQQELQETKKMMPSAEDDDGGEKPEEEKASSESEGNAHQDQKEDEKTQTIDNAPPFVEEDSIQAASPESSAGGGGEETHGAEETTEENKESKEEELIEPTPAAAPAEPHAAQVTESEENKMNTEILQESTMSAENAEVVEHCLAENANLKKQLAVAEAEVAAALIREAEMALRLSLAGEELADAKCTAGQLREKLEAAEAAKASLEAEMRTIKVQTEQWRKAAEAAAAVLSESTAEARASLAASDQRRGSTDAYSVGVGYEGGSSGFSGLWSPLASMEPEEGVGAGRRKGGVGMGTRVLGDLWRKRGQRHQHHQRI